MVIIMWKYVKFTSIPILLILLTGCINQTSDLIDMVITNTPSNNFKQSITEHPNNPNTNKFITTHEHFNAKIIKVVDGDTVYAKALNGTEYKIRLLGVDTPETYKENKPDEYILLNGDSITDLNWLKTWGINAKEFAKENLADKTVIIVFDNIAPKKGYYGRYLAYIYINNSGVLLDFNKELLTEGYARVYVSQFEKLNEYQQAEYYAKSHHIGLWGWNGSIFSESSNIVTATVTTTNDNVNGNSIIVSYIHADAAGNDNRNLNDEYIVIKNVGGSPVSLSGWKVKDDGGHTYMFPSGFVLQPGMEVTLYTGSGVNTDTDLYWGSSRAIWNNNGDTIYIIDSTGNMILTKSYN